MLDRVAQTSRDSLEQAERRVDKGPLAVRLNPFDVTSRCFPALLRFFLRLVVLLLLPAFLILAQFLPVDSAEMATSNTVAKVLGPVRCILLYFPKGRHEDRRCLVSRGPFLLVKSWTGQGWCWPLGTGGYAIASLAIVVDEQLYMTLPDSVCRLWLFTEGGKEGRAWVQGGNTVGRKRQRGRN